MGVDPSHPFKQGIWVLILAIPLSKVYGCLILADPLSKIYECFTPLSKVWVFDLSRPFKQGIYVFGPSPTL